MPAPASTSTDVAAMRARYGRALAAASRADIGTLALVSRWHAETLVALDGQPAAARAVMLQRMAILFEVVVDRRSAGKWKIGKPVNPAPSASGPTSVVTLRARRCGARSVGPARFRDMDRSGQALDD
jgi:hypothetical protein